MYVKYVHSCNVNYCRSLFGDELLCIGEYTCSQQRLGCGEPLPDVRTCGSDGRVAPDAALANLHEAAATTEACQSRSNHAGGCEGIQDHICTSGLQGTL